MLLTPEYIFADVTRITPAFLAQQGIRALVLDVDNTITEDRSQVLSPDVAQWLDDMRAAGIALTIVSNGTAKRVSPFADSIGLAWVSRSAKPFPHGLRIAQKRLGVPKSQMAMVGDQLFTDRMAAAVFGIPAYVVLPRAKDLNQFVCVKRVFEKPFWAKYYKKGGKVL